MTTFVSLGTHSLSSNLDILNSDSNDSGNLQAEFYSPVCKSGYFTPLQRKKLREKRCLDVGECLDENDLKSLKKIKRSSTPKIKKRDKILISSKRKQMNPKKNSCSVQCVLSKNFSKTPNDCVKEKKFFKSSPSKRLQNANFTMSLVFKKKVIDLDKVIKGVQSGKKKVLSKDENMFLGTSVECLGQNDHEYAAPCESESQHHPFIVKIVSAAADKSSLGSKHTNENVLQLSVPTEEVSALDFEWPDEIFVQRQERARAFQNQSILKECTNAHIESREVEKRSPEVQKSVPAKFYPIFNVPKKKLKISEDVKRVEKAVQKFAKVSLKGGEQMVIDAGQKEIGPKVCHTCGMIYTIGHEEDERLHSDYHNIYSTNLKFPGWKEENVIGEYCDGKVIMVHQSDKSFKLKKIEEVLVVANRDLGFSTAGFPTKPDVTFLLFISNQKKG